MGCGTSKDEVTSMSPVTDKTLLNDDTRKMSSANSGSSRQVRKHYIGNWSEQKSQNIHRPIPVIQYCRTLL